MKKLIMFILLIVLYPLNALAAGNINVSTYNLNVTEGSSASFRISASNAAGRVDISSSNNSIASVSSSSIFLDNQSETITVRGLKTGTTTIKVVVTDGTTYDDEDITGRTYTINVSVKEPIVYSDNNNLKSISIEGYDLEKIDDNHYKLMVGNNVEQVYVDASAEDDKARVSGIGNRTLDIGENKFEIIVTAESGKTNTIYLDITRKDGYYLDDLDKVLESNEEVDIILEKDTILTKEDLLKIKESSKKIQFSYLNEDREVVYAWIIDGTKLKDVDDIRTSLKISRPSKDLSKITNYASGMEILLNQVAKVPNGITAKIKVNDYFTNNEEVFVYGYNVNDKKITDYSDKIIVTNGYVELNFYEDANYLLTMADLDSSASIVNSTSGIMWMIIALAELVVLIVFVFTLTIKKHKAR